jgi:hypothetical protein
LNRLGRAIEESKPVNIVSACDALLAAYADYQTEAPGRSRQAKPSFDRNAGMFSLQEGTDIFTAIRVKVLFLAS